MSKEINLWIPLNMDLIEVVVQYKYEPGTKEDWPHSPATEDLVVILDVWNADDQTGINRCWVSNETYNKIIEAIITKEQNNES